MTKVLAAAEEFSSVYVYRCQNMRSQVIQQIRHAWADSKIFFAKNKVIKVALGRTVAEEAQDNYHLLSERLSGPCMLLFTSRDRKEVEDYFSTFHSQEFARMGMVVTQDVDVEAGPLLQFAHSQETYLRGLGLPTRLNRAVVTLERDYRICRKGDKLSSEQARLLKAFGMQLAEVSFTLDSVWRQGNFEIVDGSDPMDEGDDDDVDDEEEEEQEEEEIVQPAPTKKLRAKRAKK